MSEDVVFEEFHRTLFAPRGLADGAYGAVRRALARGESVPSCDRPAVRS